MKNIHVFTTIDELAVFFSQKLARLSQSNPENGYVSLALSGGSTPRAVFEYLSRTDNNSILWKNIRFFWGDERCVSPDHKESNYRMTKENLLNNISVPSENIFRIKGEENPVEEAERYSKLIADHLPIIENTPVFDLVMLGLGEDGHTASIFPPDIKLFDSSSHFVATKNPYSGQDRISATGKIINHAREVLFLVTGSTKAEIVAQIIHKKNNYQSFPASKVNPLNKNLHWLLDQEAATNL